MKLNTTAKLFAVAACILLAITGCNKDNTPQTPHYLPSTIADYASGNILDSFVFRNDQIQQIHTNIHYSYNWHNRWDFFYDNTGRCNKVYIYDVSPSGLAKLRQIDSMVYNNNTIQKYSSSYGTWDSIPSTLQLSNDHGVILIGSKDTIVSEGYKRLYYTAYNFDANNLDNIEDVYYSEQYPSSSNYTTTFTYDTAPNGFEYAFAKNPLLFYYLANFQHAHIWPAGKNNMTSTVTTYPDSTGIIKTDAGSSWNIVNFYDKATGFSIAQIYQQPNNIEWGYRFTFIRSN